MFGNCGRFERAVVETVAEEEGCGREGAEARAWSDMPFTVKITL